MVWVDDGSQPVWEIGNATVSEWRSPSLPPTTRPTEPIVTTVFRDRQEARAYLARRMAALEAGGVREDPYRSFWL